MNTETEKPGERDEIEMLLPWYATGKLDQDDVRRVETYLARHPEMCSRLSLSLAERNETAHVNGPVTQPSNETVDRFMAQIGQTGARETAVAREGIGDWIRRALVEPFFSHGQMQWVAVAAVLVILLQATAILSLLQTPDQGIRYETASGQSETVAPGTYVDVRFAPEAAVSRIAAAMSELNVTIAGGPKAGGFFLVRIGPETMSKDEIERAIAALRKRSDVVQFVTGAK
ncbi:MAG: hypothetical protein HC850_02530 [Rhodomicrobium sp.]|nr:hypothetical protein [Rhodomicrobium sp.]